MTWTLHRKLVNKSVKSKDGMIVGAIDQLEIDVATWQIKALKMEASRALLERLDLDEPSVTGGRTVYVDTMDVASVDEDHVHLKIDAVDLAKLRWHRTSVI